MLTVVSKQNEGNEKQHFQDTTFTHLAFGQIFRILIIFQGASEQKSVGLWDAFGGDP